MNFVGRVVGTMIPPSSGARGLGIDPWFPPLQESNVKSTCATTWGPQGFLLSFSLGPEGSVYPKGLETLRQQKKKKKKKEFLNWPVAMFTNNILGIKCRIPFRLHINDYI